MYRKWVKEKVATNYLVCLLIISLFGIYIVENFKQVDQHPAFERQALAAEIMQQALAEIKELRKTLDIKILVKDDPNRTGIIGTEFSDLTTTIGDLEAKRTSTNPDFAALMVRYFLEIGLKSEDVIAIGASGSFPALIVATLAAAKALNLDSVLIYSLGSSMYGANIPDLTFVQMLDFLNKKGIFSCQIAAISFGGDNDRADGLVFSGSKETFEKIANSSDLPLIYEESLIANIEKRYSIYQNEIPEKAISCFVNIGGATVNHGRTAVSANFPNGLVKNYPHAEDLAESGLLYKFLADGVPVIHLLNIKQLALKNDLPIDPVPLPAIGEGSVYFQISYNKHVIAVVLLLIIVIFIAISLKGRGGLLCKLLPKK